jgi:peptidoglycan pentaglycine glycine transferase (the first glycine)
MLREVKDKQEWNELVQKNLPISGGFLGSWEWGEFQEQSGRRVRRFATGAQEYAQVIEHTLPFSKTYWYVPRGGSIAGLSEVAKKLGVIFIRFEPTTRPPRAARKTIHISPPTTLILDLSKSEDMLLAGMHEKTRYNIRLAKRKGVEIRKQKSENSVEIFWDLLQETAHRDGFRVHQRAYYERMLMIPWVELWIAEYEGMSLAAGLWASFGQTVTYLHGASSSEHRNIMAPYALHWEAIRNAKIHGFKRYDFWGIQSNVSSFKFQVSSSWAGMTRFKKGFGGEVVDYPGTFDLPLSPIWYSIYRFVRKIRRM